MSKQRAHWSLVDAYASVVT